MGVSGRSLPGVAGKAVNVGPRLIEPRTKKHPAQTIYIESMQSRLQRRVDEQAPIRQRIQVLMIEAWLRHRARQAP